MPTGAPRRSLSSSTMRWAPLRPMPGTITSVARSSVATARRSSSGVRTAERGLGQARADPGGRLQQLEDLALVVVGEAVERQGVLAHDQRGGRAGPAGRSAARASVPGVHCTARPTPPTSSDGLLGSERGHLARDVGDHA